MKNVLKVKNKIFNIMLRSYSNIIYNHIIRNNLSMNNTVELYLKYLHIVNRKKYITIQKYIQLFGVIIKKYIYNSIRNNGIKEDSDIDNISYYNAVADKLDQLLEIDNISDKQAM